MCCFCTLFESGYCKILAFCCFCRLQTTIPTMCWFNMEKTTPMIPDYLHLFVLIWLRDPVPQKLHTAHLTWESCSCPNVSQRVDFFACKTLNLRDTVTPSSRDSETQAHVHLLRASEALRQRCQKLGSGCEFSFFFFLFFLRISCARCCCSSVNSSSGQHWMC